MHYPFTNLSLQPSDEHETLPPQLTNLIGTTHVFEIKTHTYYNYGIFKSFICCAIDPHELSAETDCSIPFNSQSVASKTSLTVSDHNQSISSVEGFACWTMNADESDIEDECSSAFISQINQDPSSIVTPSKSTEVQKKKRVGYKKIFTINKQSRYEYHLTLHYTYVI